MLREETLEGDGMEYRKVFSKTHNDSSSYPTSLRLQERRKYCQVQPFDVDMSKVSSEPYGRATVRRTQTEVVQ